MHPSQSKEIQAKLDTSPEAEKERLRRFEIRESSIQGRGGFAVDRYRANEVVAEYKGTPVTSEVLHSRSNADNRYVFQVDKTLTIDGRIPDNPAQFLNHACHPNCFSCCHEGRVWIVTLRDIEPGEELTYDYGYDIEGLEPMPCHCGAPDCFRFIVGGQHRWTPPPPLPD